MSEAPTTPQPDKPKTEAPKGPTKGISVSTKMGAVLGGVKTAGGVAVGIAKEDLGGIAGALKDATLDVLKPPTEKELTKAGKDLSDSVLVTSILVFLGFCGYLIYQALNMAPSPDDLNIFKSQAILNKCKDLANLTNGTNVVKQGEGCKIIFAQEQISKFSPKTIYSIEEALKIIPGKVEEIDLDSNFTGTQINFSKIKSRSLVEMIVKNFPKTIQTLPKDIDLHSLPNE